ncbi:thermonuclease family protein [Citricoccus nitrophenolicus]|uniref:thermonuclease family protein n=1 Tax=Citricoccus nitrophenolicus TaxID=863575 RepID=UPI0031EEADF9
MAGFWASKSVGVKIAAGAVAVAVVGGAAGVAVAQSGGSAEDRDQATVVRVIDGDTFDARINGEVERVRLLNVDTPETKHPEKSVQCLGPEAADLLEELLAPGDQIDLVYDIERFDRYDRTLAGVYKDDSLVNADLAEAGLGVAVLFEPNDRFYPEVLAAQERAEEAEAGLFDPGLECALPALAEALPPLENLPGEIPTDAADVAAALAAAVPVIAAGEVLDGAVGLVESGSHAVLSAAYGDVAPRLRERLDEALPSALAFQEGLLARQAELKQAAEEKAAEEKAAAERAAEEKAAAERAAAEKAEEERKVAEEKAAAERAAEEKAAAERAAAERVAEEQRVAEAEAEAERQRQAEAQREAEQQQEAERRRVAPPQQAPRPQQPSSGYGTDADYPGYTGPRCYAPGGQSWRPC